MMKVNSKLLLNSLLISALIVAGCDKQEQTPVMQHMTAPLVAEHQTDKSEIEEATVDTRQFSIDNTQYLFDVSDHTPAELEALLNRAEEIRETHAEGYDELEIVLILHGPDINIFRQQNYNQHKSLVDLAAKLDAFDIIDMKICETTMSKMGVQRDEVPAFIQSVPYAPDEIRRLSEEGYINL